MVVRLDSQLDEAAEYRIEVHQRDMDFDHVIYVKDGITLNSHATQRWQICFRPDPTERGLPEGSLLDLQLRLRVYLTNKDGTKQILQLPVTSAVHTLEVPSTLGARAKEAKLVLSVAEGGSAPRFKEYEGALGVMEMPLSVRINARDLPQTALAYQAVDAVLWTNGDARVLSEQGSKQMAALQQWVRQGGMLVVCQPGNEGERQRIAPFGDMLPINWQEGGQFKVTIQPKADLHPLMDMARRKHPDMKGGANWDINGPFPMARATTRPSAVVDQWIDWNGDGKDMTPYLARVPYGMGSVTWVAQDLGDPKIAGSVKSGRWPYVWDKVFGWKNDTHITGDIKEIDTAAYTEHLINAPIDLGTAMTRGAEFSSKGAGLITLAVFFFIGYWVIAGPGTYLFLANKKKSQHSWLAFGLAAVGATVLTVFVVDLVLRGSPEIHHATSVRMASGSEAQPAVAYSRVGLYIPRDGEQRVSLADGGGDFISYVTPMSVHPSYVPDNEFPANLDYYVPIRDAGLAEPASISVPFRSTLKKLDVKWSGDLSIPIRASSVVLNPTGGTNSPISGSLDNLSGIDLKNIYIAFRYFGVDYVLYLASFSAKAGDNHIDLKSTWEKAPTLPLRGGSGGITSTPDTVMFCRGNMNGQWRYYWYEVLSRGSDQVDDLGSRIPASFPALSFFDRLLPPNKEEAGTEARTLLRRGARHLNMSAALAAGELVVLAQADKRPLPYGLEVNGTRTPGEGTVFYQLALPMEHAGTDLVTESGTGN